jgi:hypothetical protein
MLVFLIPLIITFLPTFFQVKLSGMRIHDKTKLPMYGITLISFLLALTLPFGAFMISMWALPPGTNCAIGCTCFIGLGILQFFILTPVIAIISHLNYVKTHQIKI